jgi:hypothetical protein
MFQKLDPCNMVLKFDACTHYGFIYGTFDNDGVKRIKNNVAKDTWKDILNNHTVTSSKELIENMPNMKSGKKIDEFFPSLFNYADDSNSKIQSCLIDLESI